MIDEYVLWVDAAKHRHLKGNWALGISVGCGDIYQDGGASYEAKVAHVASGVYEPGVGASWTDMWTIYAIGATGPAGLPGGVLNWLGLYNAGTTYHLNDGVVSSEGRAFYALGTTTGHAPPVWPTTTNAYWSLFAEKGAAGAAGNVTNTGTSVAGQIPKYVDTSGNSIQPGPSVVTSVGDPGVDTNLPTEKAVRDALAVLQAMGLADGWIPAGSTWTYASADAPSYTFTISGDKTTKYYPGMRLKLTDNSTVKYFIITKTSYSAPNTTVTVYGGTDYTLSGGAISSNYYGMVKAPTGFPQDPVKWSVLITDVIERAQASPTAGTYYNPGSLSITVPIGVWWLSWNACVFSTRSAGGVLDWYGTLSTSTSSASDYDFFSGSQTNDLTIGFSNCGYRKSVALTTKTVYYLICKTNQASVTKVGFNTGGSPPNTNLMAVCAYL